VSSEPAADRRLLQRRRLRDGTELPLMVVPGTCDTGARYGYQPALAACNYRKRVRALGDEFTDPYFQMDGACAQVDPPNESTAYRVGPRRAGGSFSTFTHTFIDSGGDRLQRGDLENGLGLRIHAPEAFGEQWKDTMLDHPVRVRDRDGRHAALPAERQRTDADRHGGPALQRRRLRHAGHGRRGEPRLLRQRRADLGSRRRPRLSGDRSSAGDLPDGRHLHPDHRRLGLLDRSRGHPEMFVSGEEATE
jgi:hypothetical protein